MGTSSSLVWSFTTGAYLYYLRDAILLLQVLTGIDAGDISFIKDVNYGGKKGMPEVLYNIQKAAEVKWFDVDSSLELEPANYPNVFLKCRADEAERNPPFITDLSGIRFNRPDDYDRKHCISCRNFQTLS